jgi:hypothetical protein
MPEGFLKLSELPEKQMAVLEVLHDSIEMAEWEDFVKGCNRLLASPQPQLVLDLRRLQRVLSVFIGEAVRLNARAGEAGKRFALLAAGQVAEVFRMLLGGDLLEIVTDGRPPEELESREKRQARRSARWKQSK